MKRIKKEDESESLGDSGNIEIKTTPASSFDAEVKDEDGTRSHLDKSHKGTRLVPESQILSEDRGQQPQGRCSAYQSPSEDSTSDSPPQKLLEEAVETVEEIVSQAAEVEPQRKQCSGRGHKGDKWCPMSDFIANNGKVLKMCLACRTRFNAYRAQKKLPSVRVDSAAPGDGKGDSASNTQTTSQTRQCPGVDHKGDRFVPESEFRSDTGQILDTCLACRIATMAGMRLCNAVNHQGDRWRPQSEFVSKAGNIAYTCQSCRSSNADPDAQQDTKEDEKAEAFMDTVGRPGMLHCSIGSHKGERWLPEANFRSKTGKRLCRICQACRSVLNQNQNAARAKRRTKAAEDAATEDGQKAAAKTQDEHPDMRRCSDAGHEGDPWAPESQFIGSKGKATSTCRDCRTRWSKARARNRALITAETLAQAHSHPGKKRCSNRDHIGDPWLPEAEFTESGRSFNFCRVCVKGYRDWISRVIDKIKNKNIQKGMRFCGLGMHFAPEAHFTASLGPDRRTCVDCREQQARRRRKSAAKKRAVGRISQRRGRVCRKCNKTLFLDCFDTKKNGMLNKRCRTCAVQMSRAKNRPFWVKQKARYQKSRWMAAIRIAEEMRGERAADHDAIGNMGSSIDGAGSVRDPDGGSKRNSESLAGGAATSGSDHEDEDSHHDATAPSDNNLKVPHIKTLACSSIHTCDSFYTQKLTRQQKSDINEMSRILATPFEQDILRDTETYGMVRLDGETLNQLSIRLAKAAISQTTDLELHHPLDQIMNDCRRITNAELNFYYLQEQYSTGDRFNTIRKILRDYFEQKFGRAVSKWRGERPNCQPILRASELRKSSEAKQRSQEARSALEPKSDAPLSPAAQQNKPYAIREQDGLPLDKEGEQSNEIPATRRVKRPLEVQHGSRLVKREKTDDM